MTKLVAALFAIGMGVAALSTGAQAHNGCGYGWHANAWGHCVRNGYGYVRAPGVVVAAPGIGIVVGAPVHHYGRVCPGGWHLNRWGHCVRNW